jgi:hypothetical protein
VGEERGSRRGLAVASKAGASVATAAAAAGLIVFAHVGAFDESNDPFPHSAIAPRAENVG